MIQMELRATNLKYIQDRLTKLGTSLTGETVHYAMLKRGQLIVNRARELAPIATGTLRKSFYVHSSATKNNIYVRVGNSAFYAAYVEEGTRPHMPPVAAIAAWVRIKNLVGSNPRRIIQRRGIRIMKEDEEEQLAWAIARKISRKGTRAQKFFAKAVKDTDAEGKAYVYRAVEHAIRQNWGR